MLHRRRRTIAQARRQLQVQFLEPRMLLDGEPVITEFQASNATTLADEDQEFSDWIEIHNPENIALDLSGWYLTDDDADLRKWQFPAGTSLDVGQYMTVFASGKDRVNPASSLHTNFRLSADGEHLALVKPDGVTVAQAYDFPAQSEDGSYGLAVGRDVSEFVTSGSLVRAFVPENGQLGTSWTEEGFDDSSWLAGTTGVGYELLEQGFHDRNDFDAPLGPEWTVDNPGAAAVNVVDGALSLQVPTGLDTSSQERGAAPIVFRDVPKYPSETAKTPKSWEVTTHISQRETDEGNAGIMIYDAAAQKPVIKLEYSARERFELTVSDDRKDFDTERDYDAFFLRLVRDGYTRTWTGFFKRELADEWIELGVVTDGVDDVPVILDPKLALFATSSDSTMNATIDFIEFDSPDERASYSRLIGLDVADELRGNNGSIYMRFPFTLDGDPTRFDDLNMNVRFDDGYRAYLNGELIGEFNTPLPPPPPAPNVLPWDAHAEGTHGAIDGRVPVTQINLDEFIGSLKNGQNLLTVQGLNFEPDDLDFFFDAELFASKVVLGKQQAFTSPTPGAANVLAAALPPVVIGEEGLFFGSTTVEIRLAEPSPTLEIRYTTDGSEPTQESLLSTGPITLTESAMLQARVFDTSENPVFDPSAMSAATFIAAADELRDRTSDIPLIILDTIEQRVPSSGSTSLASVNVVALETSRATGRSSLAEGIVDYLGRGGIRDRGSSTAGQQKPNLSFELWGANGSTEDDDADAALLGFAPESDWVLHAPFSFDRAMIRNQFAFGLSNQIGRWAPGTRAVEVYLNRNDGVVTERDYLGVYVLMEKIKQGAGRVDIADIKRDQNQEPEVSGGYIWKIDRTDPDAGTFSAGSLNLNWVHPKSPRSRTARDDQQATTEQQAWVIDHFNEANQALTRTDINDPEGYSKYIDVGAFVDHHLLSVLMDDVDAFVLSAYLLKDRNGKIQAGPLWDFDRSMESLDDRDDDPTLWGGSGGSNFFDRVWYGRLFRDAGFWQAYVDRWTELRQTDFRLESIDALIDRLAAEIEESQDRNFLAPLNRGVRPRRSSRYASGELDGTWQGEVEHMRKWLHERVAFIDSMFTQPPRLSINGTVLGDIKGLQVTAEQQVEVLGPESFSFNDAAFFSGEPGQTIASYLVPLDNSLGTDWTTVDFDDSQWSSGPAGIGFDSRDAETGVITGDFAELIRTPLPKLNEIQDGATTILTRFPFEVADLAAARDKQLVLRMKYDDGFVAYLNGVEVHRENLRDEQLSWDSRASTRAGRDSEIAEKFADFDLSDFKDLLVQGKNVLAIRGINTSTSGGDLLILPELVSREIVFGINPKAQVFYTTDGTDPRAPDGSVNPTATLAEAGQLVTVASNTRVTVRALDEETDRGNEARLVRTDWSGMIQYDFAIAISPLVISEVNFNPAAVSQAEAQAGYENDDFEFIEIHNPGNGVASLVGVELADGVQFDFMETELRTLPPGAYAVIARNAEAFSLRYGLDPPVAGVYQGQLDNAGENLDLVDATGQAVFSINYGDDDPWPVRADGFGASLELIDLAATASSQQSKWYRWRASSEFGGSPGRAGNGPVGVVINEILANAGDGMLDSIELVNTSEQAIDLGGWFLSDTADDLFKFAIAPGTVLQPGQYRVFDESEFSFGLSGSRGDDVWLVQRDNNGSVSTFADDVHFDATIVGESLGRVPNATGRYSPLQRLSLGTANTDPRVGPLVISEIQFNPVISAAALAVDPTLDEGDLEFVEIINPTPGVVNLSNWRLRGGVDYDFDDGILLGANESVVVLGFNPAVPDNINRVAAFRAQYDVGADVRLLGGFAGRLNDSGDRVVLLRSLTQPDAAVTRVQEDEVLYDDQDPWPMLAGTGFSLQRKADDGFGNDAGAWRVGPASPGSSFVELPGDFDGTGDVSAADIDLLFEQLRSPAPDVRFDLTNDGRVDSDDRDQLVQGLLGTGYGDANLDGVFNSSDLVLIFKQGLFEDDLALNAGWQSGDWDGDGEFSNEDLLFALREGSFEN